MGHPEDGPDRPPVSIYAIRDSLTTAPGAAAGWHAARRIEGPGAPRPGGVASPGAGVRSLPSPGRVSMRRPGGGCGGSRAPRPGGVASPRAVAGPRVRRRPGGGCGGSRAPRPGGFHAATLDVHRSVRHGDGMQVGLRHLRADTVEWLKAAAAEDGRTRHALARELCEREDWRNARGQPCVSQARGVLPGIAKRAGFVLPAARPGPRRTPGRPGGEVARTDPDRKLACTLADLGEVTLVPVGAAPDRRRWREMMETHHPQGWKHRPGKVLNFWVVSSRHGRLGGLGYTAAGWHQAARDAAIGWSATARAANLAQLVQQHRFLLLPGVRVAQLASHVLARSTARLAADWKAAHGTRPQAVYTYVGPEHRGTCYRAAGWSRCAEPTSGRPPGGRATAPKAVWIRPLAEGWREVLSRERGAVLGTTSEPWRPGNADWADLEYGRGSHPDGRVRTRVLAMGRAWENAPGASLPVIFPSAAAQKAAYRLLSSARVTMEHILDSHAEATVERCRQERVVLVLQDTTTLNYNGHCKTKGRVNLGGGGSGTRGILAHFTLAVTEGRRPLGVIDLNATQREGTEAPDCDATEREDTEAPDRDATEREGTEAPDCDATEREGTEAPDCDATEREGTAAPDRDAVKPESVRWLQGLERARQLAAACPDTRVVTVCDREGDIWERFGQARAGGVGLLVRSDRGRQRRVVRSDGSVADLWEAMAEPPVLGTKTVHLAACGGPRRRLQRTVILELRAAAVHLVPPKNRDDRTPMPVLAVSVREARPPKGRDPLHGVLLSTEGEADLPHARRIVAWYEARGTLEEYFRVLKVGARIEERKLQDADDLRTCLAFDAITAWRVMDLERLARDPPRPRVLHRPRNRGSLPMAPVRSHHPGPAREAARHPHLRGRSRPHGGLPTQQTSAASGYCQNLAGVAEIQDRTRIRPIRREPHEPVCVNNGLLKGRAG